MKKKISRSMLEQLLEQYDIIDDVDECNVNEEDGLEESPVKPELSTAGNIMAKKLQAAISQYGENSPEVADIKQIIKMNKEKQLAASASAKADKINQLIKKQASQPQQDQEQKTDTDPTRVRDLLAKGIEKRLAGKSMFIDSKKYKNAKAIKENYIKNLRMLLENEVEQASVLMAAKGFSQEIQTMIEKMGRLMNEELGPVVDNMRMAYGQQQAESFGEAMRTDMQSIMDTLLSVKQNIDDAVDELAAGQVPSMTNDMDGDIEGMDSEGFGGEEEMGDELEGAADLDKIADDFGGEEAASGPEEDPLGRPQKESIQNLKKQLSEMKSKLAKAKKLKETK